MFFCQVQPALSILHTIWYLVFNYCILLETLRWICLKFVLKLLLFLMLCYKYLILVDCIIFSFTCYVEQLPVFFISFCSQIKQINKLVLFLISRWIGGLHTLVCMLLNNRFYYLKKWSVWVQDYEIWFSQKVKRLQWSFCHEKINPGWKNSRVHNTCWFEGLIC